MSPLKLSWLQFPRSTKMRRLVVGVDFMTTSSTSTVMRRLGVVVVEGLGSVPVVTVVVGPTSLSDDVEALRAVGPSVFIVVCSVGSVLLVVASEAGVLVDCTSGTVVKIAPSSDPDIEAFKDIESCVEDSNVEAEGSVFETSVSVDTAGVEDTDEELPDVFSVAGN